jgi:TonB-dependent receptor
VIVTVGQDRNSAINGRITDPEGRALQGARVELQPRGQTAITDSQGQFIISDVPPGDYTLTVSSVGFALFSKPVKIVSGAVAQVDASLQISDVSAEVTVRPERQRGEVEALNRERTADNIVQVLPANVIRSLPNTNVADAVGRLPSVSLERDEGEGKYVQIRGTEPRLSNVTINGIHVSSPEGNVRQVKLDVIPSDLVESIEVSKTLSANQDGDAIGGSINLVTRMAGDTPFYSMSALYGYTHILNGRSLTQYSGTVGRRFGADKKLGILFGGTYDYNGRAINDIEPSQGTNDFGVPTVFSVDLREYKYYRHRYGFAGGADYRLKNGSSAYVRGLFSDFKDYGDTWLYTPANDGSVSYEHYIRRPDQQIFSLTAGENLNLGKYVFNYQFAVSRSRQIHNVYPATYFDSLSNFAFNIDTSNPLVPKFIAPSGVNIYDPTQYKISRYVDGDSRARELDFEGSASLIRNYSLGSRFGSFEFGGKIRNANKKQMVNLLTYDATGASAITLNQVLGNTTDPNYYFKQYALGPLSDYGKIQSAFNANPAAFFLNVEQTRQRSDPNNYNTTERVFAAYAMNTITFGKARLQTGLRVETTQSKFTGNQVTFDANGKYVSTIAVPGKNNYTDVLPSVQFQYAITPNTNFRAAYGIGIARPNFGDLPPYIVENDRRQSVRVGNPLLKPTRAQNFDVLVERYLKPYGLIQFGAFYKDLKNPIYSTQTQITGGQFVGFAQTQPTNGTKAHIAGIEASYQQQLLFLPGILNGLGFSANYSYTASKAIVPNRAVNPSLIRQAPNNYNFDVTYDKSRFSGRIGLTHNDAYIYSYNYTDGADAGIAGPNGDIYLYPHTQLDAQISYRLKRGFKLIAYGLNLNNEVFGFYQGSPQYPIQREFYNRTFSIGFRWSSAGEK